MSENESPEIAKAHAAVSGLSKEQRAAIATIIREGAVAMRGIAEHADRLVALLEADPPQLDVLAREMTEFRVLINGLTSMFSLASMTARVRTVAPDVAGEDGPGGPG